MPEPKQSIIRRILEHKIFMVANLLVLGFLTLSLGREFVRDYQIQREIDALQQDAEQLEMYNLEVARLNAELETRNFLETEARLKLGMSKPGERLVVVVDDSGHSGSGTVSADATASAEQIAAELAAASNPARWWYYFFDQQKLELIKYHYGY